MKNDNIARLMTRIANLPIGVKQIAVGDTEEYLFIEEAVEKARAQEVKQIKVEDYLLVDVCPSCKKVLSSHYDYCYHCGQKLDWGNGNE